MKKIGLLFTPENRALVRSGPKTQTRRGDKRLDGLSPGAELHHVDAVGQFVFTDGSVLRCPYGNPQDEPTTYCVKEPVQVLKLGTTEDGGRGFLCADVLYPDTGEQATCEISLHDHDKLMDRIDWRKPSSSMFMLQAFARTWLPGVRTWPERLGDLSAADAIAEGIERDPDIGGLDFEDRLWRDYLSGGYDLDPKQSYASLWESINGEGSWNPEKWVWCVEWQAPGVAA